MATVRMMQTGMHVPWKKGEILTVQVSAERGDGEYTCQTMETFPSDLKTQHASEIASVTDQHEKQLADLRGAHVAHVDDLKDIHQGEVDVHKATIADLQSKVVDLEATVTKLQNELDGVE